MINANHNSKNRERRIEIDCWLEGGAPYLVSMFDPDEQPEPVISELFDAPYTAGVAAQSYARIHGISRIYDNTGER